ncbi:MAG TPA: TadG family pilus assembly protein [Methylomirabilota bacterium]|jgi:Flp pilus assembly protein TadG
MKIVREIVREERGNAVLLGLGFMLFLIAVGGIAIDLAYQMAAIGEVERSMEAAALAGAGKLGFNDTVFPAVRAAAQQYALLNPYHNAQALPITLSANTGNAPNGNIVLGVWTSSTGTFTPSLDGTVVNAVQCQWQTTIPTSYLRVLGFQTLPVRGQAVAIANPPQLPPPQSCVFPIGLSSCPFQNGGAFSSSGCGVNVKFITSNGQAGSTNTAAWVNMNGPGTPNAQQLNAQITAAQNGNCNATPPSVGNSVGTNNGMANNVFQTLKDAFVAKFNQSVASHTNYMVKDVHDNIVYNGPGWQVYVPVIQTQCNANGTTQAITQDHTVIGWTRFVMTQAWDTSGHSSGCAVSNPADAVTSPWCTNPPEELRGGASRSIFGYYECGLIDSTPVLDPTPRAALGNRLRLVKTN